MSFLMCYKKKLNSINSHRLTTMEEKRMISVESHRLIIEDIKRNAFHEIQKVRLEPNYTSSLERKWIAPTHKKIEQLMCEQCKGKATLILYQLIKGFREERKDLHNQIQLQRHRNKLKNEVLSKLLFFHCDIVYKEENLERDFERIKEIIKQMTHSQNILKNHRFLGT